jgi:hypothetical protein
VDVREPLGLLADGLGDLAHTVAHSDNERATGGVDQPVPLVVPDVHTLGPHRAWKAPPGVLAIEDAHRVEMLAALAAFVNTKPYCLEGRAPARRIGSRTTFR